jgi:alpha-1,2-mannosyltransferase
MLAALRSGSFVTRERMRAYSLLLLVAYIATIVVLLATARGIVDTAGRPIGTDFANVYAAGKLALAGEPAQAYDWPAHHEMQKRISGREDIGYFGWHYPPAFLIVATALAALPYLAALFVYQAATLAAYLVVVRRIAGCPEAWLLALAFPAVFVNVTHGHNGFITAALLGGALLVLDHRPLVAGALLGCLAYKPQFGLLVPLVLTVTGRWRVIAAAAATVLAIAALTWALFGADVFAAFWHSLPMTQRVILEGAPGFHKIQSVYAALRQLGVPTASANAVQMATTLGVAALLVVLWRSAAAFELKAAALLVGCVLATPYALDYDLVVLAPAIAFLAAHGLRQGFAPWEIALLVALWVLPLVARPIAELTAVSLTPIAILTALGLIVHRSGALRSLTARLSSPGGRASSQE